MALNGVDRSGDWFWGTQITEAPSGHSVSVGEPVNGDGEIIVLRSQGCDTYMLGTFVNEFFVNLVRQNQNLFLRGDGCDCFQLLASVNGSGRIVRRIDDDHLGPRRHRVFKLFGSELPSIFFLGLNEDRIGPGQPHHLRIAQPIWFRDNDFVARLTGSENGVVTGTFCPTPTDTSGRPVTHLIAPITFFLPPPS